MAIGLGAIFSAGSSILSGIGRAKQIKAENARRIREYERALEIRKRNWFQQLSVYSAKVNKYNIDLNENDLAAQRGYAKAQSNLRALGGKVAAENEASFIKLISKKLGARRASGQTGRGVARGETLDVGTYLRDTGRRAYGISMAREKAKENMESIRRRQISARRGMYSNVAFNPVPSMAPNPPQLRGTGMTMLSSFLGAAGSIVGAMDKDVGAPTEDSMSFGDIYNADVGSLTGGSFTDFGGTGAFTNYDLGVNNLPDFGAGAFSEGFISEGFIPDYMGVSGAKDFLYRF